MFIGAKLLTASLLACSPLHKKMCYYLATCLRKIVHLNSYGGMRFSSMPKFSPNHLPECVPFYMQTETQQSEQKKKMTNKDWEIKHTFIPVTPYSFQTQTHKPVMTHNWLNCGPPRAFFKHTDNISCLYWQAPCTSIRVCTSMWVWQYITLHTCLCAYSLQLHVTTPSHAVKQHTVRMCERHLEREWQKKRVTKIREAHSPSCDYQSQIIKQQLCSHLLTFPD